MSFLKNFSNKTLEELELTNFEIVDINPHITKIVLEKKYDDFKSTMFSNVLEIKEDIVFMSEKNKINVLWSIDINRPVKSKFFEKERKCLKSISFSETKTKTTAKIKNDLNKRLFTQEAHSELINIVQEQYKLFNTDIENQLTAKQFAEIIGLERNAVENGVLTVSKHDKNMNRIQVEVFPTSTNINLRIKDKEEVKKLLTFWKNNITFEE